jgi:hypothetical protein
MDMLRKSLSNDSSVRDDTTNAPDLFLNGEENLKWMYI